MAELPLQYIEHLQNVSTEMTIASANVVVAAQEARGSENLDLGVSIKDDASILSKADPESEAAAKAVWHERTPHPILGEETGVSTGNKKAEAYEFEEATEVPAGRILGMNDPVDGTRPFVNGAHTSTVMGGAYDLQEKRFVASTVVHPTSGTIIEASNGATLVSRLHRNPLAPPDQQQFWHDRSYRQPSTWEGPLEGSTVLVDNFAPFKRGKGEEERIITDRNRLLHFQSELLEVDAVPQSYGSNGYHQMLLAQGGEKLAGAVMLSQGGPWDALGLLGVENAGGHAHAFAVKENGSVEERDPHDPFNWDILVLGSTAVNADKLAGVIERTYPT